MSDTMKLCRLCLSASNLLNVFDPKASKLSMRFHVFACAGIHIDDDDQCPFVCKKCWNSVKKQLDFKARALEIHRALEALRNKAKESEPPKTTNVLERVKSTKKIVLLRWSDVHWSVKQLCRDYKNIMIPRRLLKTNVCPTVALTRCVETDVEKHQCVDKYEICSTEQTNKRRRLSKQCVICVKSLNQ